MKIYTKTGDEGQTGLFGGSRLSKAHARVEAYGTVDELNSCIGLSCAEIGVLDAVLKQYLTTIQNELFSVGAELGASAQKRGDVGVPLISENQIARLETEIDSAEQELTPLRTFVLPGGTLHAARLHVARAVCRRAERRLVALAENEDVRPELVRYLNRLSDWLFVMARIANRRQGLEDVPWRGR